MRIIGIDPGIATTGYGVVETNGQRSVAVAFGCIKTASDLPGPQRLAQIYGELTDLVAQYAPDAMAVEKLFFARNSTSAMQVGEARGVAVLAGQLAGLRVYEYTPLQVKQSVVGYGRAEKSQVQQMVKVLLCLSEIPRPDDAADALAIALCHAHSGPMIAVLGRRGNYV
ncbi:MAG: crossover junction endodeoxyribonuclease RuvC [Bacillota bacterium]|nr:crossover junction endodeoxyribonuclease RuvC [Bacillota bacterium]MDW7682490.1 crossover junction endodeoxyribonuclease RuvC [Bacillota bacterium]